MFSYSFCAAFASNYGPWFYSSLRDPSSVLGKCAPFFTLLIDGATRGVCWAGSILQESSVHQLSGGC